MVNALPAALLRLPAALLAVSKLNPCVLTWGKIGLGTRLDYGALHIGYCKVAWGVSLN